MRSPIATGKSAARALAKTTAGNERKLARLLLGAAALAMFALLLLFPTPWDVPTGPDLFPHGRRALGHTIRISLWWAALAELVLLIGLLLTLPYWLRPVQPNPQPSSSRPPLGRAWWAALLIIMALAGVLRWPLAGGSLWWDEGWSVRRVVVGAYERNPADGTPVQWKAVDVRHALWSFRKPTNHVAYNVSAWATDRLWRTFAAPSEPHVFSERAFRAPALAAGVLGIGATALVAAAWGAPVAGLVAATWLAVHPWHHRYGVDGRAYSFVLLFTPLAALFLTRFLGAPRTRDLLAYCLGIGLLLWSFPYAVMLVATWYAFGLATILMREPDRPQAIAWSLRFSAAHLFVAMSLIFLMAPNLTQLAEWHYNMPVVSASALNELWSGLAAGIPATAHGRVETFPSLEGWWDRAPWMMITADVIIPALMVLGLFHALRMRASRPVASAWMAAALVSFGINALAAQHFFPRYGVFLLPAVALLIGLALAPQQHPRRWPWAAAALLLFVVVTQPERSVLMHYPYSPMRSVAERVAAELRAAGPGTVGIGIGIGGGMPAIYEPELRFADSKEDLLRACRESHDHERPLVAFYGYAQQNRSRRGPAIDFLEDPQRFALIAEYDGIEPRFCYRVFRSLGESCAPD